MLNSVKERGSNGALRSQLSPVRHRTSPPSWVPPACSRGLSEFRCDPISSFLPSEDIDPNCEDHRVDALRTACFTARIGVAWYAFEEFENYLPCASASPA